MTLQFVSVRSEQMEKSEKLENLLRSIVGAIAKKTPDPFIRHFERDAIFELQVNGQDQGRFIGKSGSHIWAIQTLFWYAGLAQCGWSYNVRLLEPSVPCRGLQMPFQFKSDWDRDLIRKLIDDIIFTCTPCHAVCDIKEESETSAIVHLNIQKYLERNMGDPCFVDAFSTVLKAAGMSQGANLKTEAKFQ